MYIEKTNPIKLYKSVFKTNIQKHSLPIEFPALASLEVLFLKGNRII